MTAASPLATVKRAVSPGLDRTADALAAKRVRIGIKLVDPTHALRVVHGMRWCARCGAHASLGADTTGRCKGLGAPCSAETSAGKEARKLLERGKHPRRGHPTC